jgi:LmbE family N-acetylglucosaminyl deacetylase
MALLLTSAAAEGAVRYYPSLGSANDRDRILIVAPHIDDESIAAAGYAVEAMERGADVYVVFLTAGDCNRISARIMHKTLEPTASNYLSVGRTRINEAYEAMEILGIPEDRLFVLGYPDRGLRLMLSHPLAVVRSRGTQARAVPYFDAVSPGSDYTLANVINDLKRVIEVVNPTTVIAPVAFDLHEDHAAAAEITDRALDDLDVAPQRLGYLVHTGRRIAKNLLNTPTRALLPPSKMKSFSWATYPLSSRVQKLKTSVLMTYRSQRPYVFLLRNAFVRSNELFFVYPEREVATVGEAAPPRLKIAR